MLLTKFVENFDKETPLNEYPRPQLVRDSYLNLNGRWDFKISKSEDFNASSLERYLISHFKSIFI